MRTSHCGQRYTISNGQHTKTADAEASLVAGQVDLLHHLTFTREVI